MLEDLRVAAARGNVGKADRADVGAHAVSRERRRNHDALAERHIVVVERDDDGKRPRVSRTHASSMRFSQGRLMTAALMPCGANSSAARQAPVMRTGP